MTVMEALERVIESREDKSEVWARPILWRGTGSAITVRADDDALLCVPSPRGGSPYSLRSSDVLVAWEVVTPDEVLAEYEGLWR